MNDSSPCLHPKFDAILVAGEGESSYKVYHEHKAFLEIDGKCVINYVIEALQRVDSIKDIYIVGLKDKLERTLRNAAVDSHYPKTIHLVDQRANLYENIFHTFLKTIPGGESTSITELEASRYRDKAVLIVPCDSPLLTPHEVEHFIHNCDMTRYDHVLGLTPEEILKNFYPQDNRPGIKMAYLHLKEKSYRINNLHLVKPLRITNREYIQKMYQYRYQRNFKNFIFFGLSLYGKTVVEHYRYYIGLQLCLLFSRLGWKIPVRHFRKWTPKRDLEQCISTLLKTRFMGLEVPYPGAALDIDRDSDYEAIKTHFDEWRADLIQPEHLLPHASEHLVTG